MRILSLFVAMFGCALAGGALLLASWQLSPPAERGMTLQDASATVRVLVAKESLPYASIITPDQLAWREWPRQSVPEGAFTSLEHLLGPAHDFERRATGPIEKNEPILLARITEPGEQLRLQTQLAEGMVAVSIRVDAVSSVSGFARVGDRVDVNHIADRNGELTSDLILQNVRVLAVDQNADATSSAARVARTVTVEVNRRGAQLLSLAQLTGTLSLILRRDGEAGAVDSAPIGAGELGDGPKSGGKQGPAVIVRKQGVVVDTVRVGDATEKVNGAGGN